MTRAREAGDRFPRLYLANLDVDGHLVIAGNVALGRAAERYIGKVEQFLDEYSYGTRPGQPVPFGGRKTELNQLDVWLDDPGAPPRYLISGPTGRGKSALLVRWRERLTARLQPAADVPTWRLVFFPISLRAGTNAPEIVYEAIAANLADVLKVELPASEIGSVSYYQNQCRELCDQIIEQKLRVLIVLDGLDEILGGEFDAAWFPRYPGTNLRLVAAARWIIGDEDASGWVKRLDWDHDGCVEARDLAILSREGVRDVLASIGAPLEVLAQRPEVVEKLQRLSEGEPLLLRLYAEDLWSLHEAAGQLRLEDLDEIQPGFAAYFEKRLEKQKEAWQQERERGAVFCNDTLYAYLAVLACAQGRMPGADLRQLVQRAHRLLPEYRLEDTLGPVRRFVYGASPREEGAKAEGGYMLSHPKFGEFFQSYLDAAFIERTKAAFVAWGEETVSALNAGTLAPEQAPPYLVQFYAHHLETMNARVDQFRRLLEDDWRRAWQAREGGFQGFTNDVQIAWTAIRCALLSTECNVLRREQLLGAAIRCALCMSSVCSLGANIPASLLGACLQRGILKASQALHLAGLQDGPRGRAEAFTAILPYLGESERTRGLTEALDAIGDMSDPALTVTLLAELASQIGPAFWNRAVDIANRISNQENRAQALAILMLHSNSQEEKSTLFEHALALTKSLSRPSIVKTLLLAGLAFRRSDVDGDFPNASELFSEAFAVASSIKDDFFKIEALTQLALSGVPFAVGDVASAAITAANVSSPDTKARALVRLARLRPGDGQVTMTNDAIAAARSVPNLYHRIGALIAVASHIDDDEKYTLFEEARTQADMKYFWYAVILYIYYFDSLSPDDLAYIDSIVNRHSSVVRSSFSTPPRCMSTDLARNFGVWHAPDRWIDVLAPILSDEPLRKTLLFSQGLADADECLPLLRVIANALPDDQRSEPVADAWAVAKAISDQMRRIRELRELAPLASDEQQAEVLQMVMEIDDENARARELGSLAPYIPTASVNQALAAVRSADDSLVRAQALTRLASRLADDDRNDVLDEAWAAMEESEKGPSTQVALEIALGYSKRLRARALVQTLERIRQSASGLGRASALCRIAPYLDRRRRRRALKEALAIADANRHELYREDVLPAISKEFPKEALDIAMRFEDPAACASAVAEIAPNLPEAHIKAAMPKVLAKLLKTDDASRVRFLSDFVPYWPNLLPQAMMVLKRLPETGTRGRLYVTLAQRAEEDEHRAACIDGAIAAAREYHADHAIFFRAALLAAVLPLLSGARFFEVFSDLTECWFGVSRRVLLRQLKDLLPKLAEVGGPAAVRDVFVAVRDVSEWWP